MIRRRAIRELAVILTVTLAIVVTVLGVGTRANAATESPTYTAALLTTRLTACPASCQVPLLKLPARTFTAGQRVLYTARFAATNDYVRIARQALRLDATGAAVVRSTTASINHDGKSYGTQYVSVRWLFVAPVTGSYTITARAEATSNLSQPGGIHLTPVRSLTYLSASTVHAKSLTWTGGTATCVNRQAVPKAAADIPACAVKRDRVSVTRTVARAAGTKAQYLAGLELSREYGSYPGGNGVLTVTMTAQPLTATGAKCGKAGVATWRPSITSNKHHYRLNGSATAATGSCPRLALTLVLDHYAGNPVGLEGPAETDFQVLWS